MKIACKYLKDSSTITLYFPDEFDSINLLDGSVTTAKLASGSVTTLKIVDEAIEAVKLATASITSTKVATAAIGSSHLQDALITTAKIATLAVDSSRLADLTITAGKLASSCVETSKIANLAVGAAAIASGAIGTAKIADAAIIEAKIDNAAVTSAKIYDLAVTNAKINDLSAVKITTGYLNTNRIEAGSIALTKITGLGDLATENNLDGVPNGTTYSRVLTTAISAGKIVLTSAGVTGTLPTSLTVAKCTDVNADQTSAHGQNLGWLIGSTGELTISSGGKLKLNCSNALEIMAAGNIKVLAGGDINMYAAAGNPSQIKFYGTTGVAACELSSLASNNLDILPATTTAKRINIGSSSRIWNLAEMYARSTYLYSYWDNNDCSLLKGVSGNGSSYIQFYAVRNGIGGTFSFSGVAASSVNHKDIDLGYADLAFDDCYADDYHNVADFYNFDRYDDLAVINQIKGSGVIQDHNGYELIDDNTLPAWLRAKHKKDGEIVDTETHKVTKTWKKGNTMSDPEGKPYLSLKACISLSWGAIRQLDRKIEALGRRAIN